jgi:DNA-binding transcriptional ArsR family regulator
MREFLSVAKAISDETRARIVMFLRSGELCVCQIVDVLGLAPSTVSKHMAILMQAGLVDLRKDGRWRYYRLASQDAPLPVRDALEWVHAALDGSSVVREDARRLQMALKKDVKTLCERYKC